MPTQGDATARRSRCRRGRANTKLSYNVLLALMQAAVDREANQQVDWNAEWGDQLEQD